MRCNSDHHTVNFIRGTAAKMHHMAFELKDFIHLQNSCDLFGQKQIPIIWGPLRHGPGHNLATYHRNPDDQVIEFFCELDKMVDEELGYFEPRPWHRTRRNGRRPGKPARPASGARRRRRISIGRARRCGAAGAALVGEGGPDWTMWLGVFSLRNYLARLSDSELAEEFDRLCEYRLIKVWMSTGWAVFADFLVWLCVVAVWARPVACALGVPFSDWLLRDFSWARRHSVLGGVRDPGPSRRNAASR